MGAVVSMISYDEQKERPVILGEYIINLSRKQKIYHRNKVNGACCRKKIRHKQIDCTYGSNKAENDVTIK